jgi:hypothetical protein
VDTFVLRIFQSEVALQCRIVLSACHNLNAALVLEAHEEVWKHLQTILMGGANLSKMFWGSAKGSQAERTPLRQSLGVNDDSPLHDRQLRNDFEHFDERVEKWFAKSEERNYVGRTIGPPGMIVGIKGSELFRQFDPSTGRVAFWDHEVSVRDIYAEVQRILPLAETEARKSR